MRFWMSETVSVGLEWLCILSGHARGCWVLNGQWSPFRRLWLRMADEFYRQQDYVGRHTCPYCDKDRPLPSRGHEWCIVTENTTASSSGNSGITWGAS